MIFDDLFEEIEEGILGKNVGLPNGFDRLNKIIFNIQKRTYYTIGGEPGAGKSSLALSMFVYSPYTILKDKNKLKVLYFSKELPKEEIYAKFLCRRLYDIHGIVLNVNTILGRGDSKLPKEYIPLIKEEEKFFYELEDNFTIIDGQHSPAAIYALSKKFLGAYGTFKDTPKKTKDGVPYKETSYIPNDPEVYTVIMLDHAGLISGDDKESIDKVSRYFIWLRNTTSCSPVMIQQLNRAKDDPTRIKAGMFDPKLSDWKGSGTTIEDCNIALSIFSPLSLGASETGGYNINLLRDRYRSIGVLKNRYGPASKHLGVAYHGEIMQFTELMPVEELGSLSKTDQKNYYNNVMELNKTK